MMNLETPGRKNPAFLAYHYLWCALDWLYPPTCVCGKPGVRWCQECRAQVKPLTEICPLCGAPQRKGQPCHDCHQNPPPYQALRSCSLYSGTLRDAIHHLKYDKDIGLGEVLASHMIDLFLEQAWNVDLVTAVPLSRKRLRERGYNQAGMLARPLALFIQKPYVANLLERTRETASQVKLNAVERRQNVADAFRAKPKWTEGKTILIVDDVTTTGATIQACSRALLNSGATAVYGLTLARADRQLNDSAAPASSV